MKNTEIEIQVEVEKVVNLVKFLKKNAKFLKEEVQIDEYYTPNHRDFTKKRPIKEWLRLRKSKNGVFITYKNWHHDKKGKSYHCDEYEVLLDSFKQIKNIFSVLDFKKLVTVEKRRSIWRYKNYEICLDKIKNLGKFVEIEYKGRKKTTPKKEFEKMIEFLKSLKVGRIKHNFQGYPFQIMFPKEVESFIV